MIRPIRPQLRNQSCIWVTGQKRDGKMALLGPYFTDNEADEMMFDAFPNDTGKKHYMNTVDRSRVTSILKHELFKESHDLDSSMKPISHIYNK